MSKSEMRRTTKGLTFRLTPDEHEAVKTAATMRGIGVTTFARRATFAASNLPIPTYEQKRNPMAADLAKVLSQLGRLASSANQLTKVANASGRPVSPVSIWALVDELKALRKDIVHGSEAR